MAEKNGKPNGEQNASGYAEGSLATRFKPGNPGGPGRPKKERTLAHLQEQYLDEEVTIPVLNEKGKPTGATRTTTNRQLFIESQTRRAINGDPQAARNLWNRQDGKVTETVEHVGGVTLNMIYDPALDGPRDKPDD